MRKLFFALCALLSAAFLFAAAACGTTGNRQTKVYLDCVTADGAAELAAASCVSILSGTVDPSTRVLKYEYFSGVIVDSAGYVLTTADAAAQDGGERSFVYAVLPELYGDKATHRLDVVAYDGGTGLAVLRFRDAIYHYTDEQHTAAAEGFPVWACLRDASVTVGEKCLSAGNSLGALLNAANSLQSAAAYVQPALTGGIVSAEGGDFGAVAYGGSQYPYYAVSAPVGPEMLGGGVFDADGYLIGLAAHKLYSPDGDAIARLSLVHGVPLLTTFLDGVSAAKQTVIPYTIASGEVNA